MAPTSAISSTSEMTSNGIRNSRKNASPRRAVVGAVSDAVGHYLTHPGMDADSLAESLCRIFAP